MRKMVLLGLLALVPVVAQAQVEIQRATLMSAFDLDGEAADADQVVTTANGDLLDAKTFTITAQPDACRLIDMTVTDANSSLTAGVITVTGTGCLGEARVCTFTFAAGGSGIKSFTCSDGEGAYYAAITTIITGALTIAGHVGRARKQHIGMYNFDWSSNHLQFAVREPWPSRSTQAGIVFGRVDRDHPLRMCHP